MGGELSFFLERKGERKGRVVVREELYNESGRELCGQLSSGAVTWSFNRIYLMIDLIFDAVAAAFNKVVCFLVHSMKIRVIIIITLILHYEEANRTT